MKTSEIQKGQKVKNQYGQTLTVIEVVDLTMIRTREDGLYHFTKVFINGKSIS